jgi:hypothetical protein
VNVVDVDPDDDVPLTIKVPPPIEVAVPKATVNGSAPPLNPPPPNPRPLPEGLPENPPDRVQPAEVGIEIDTERAAAGPVEGEDPSTCTQSPTARSEALAATVWANVVDDVQSTVTELPVRGFWTTIDDLRTEETTPEAKGRPWDAGVVAAAGDDEEAGLELHAPSTSAPALTTATATLRGIRGPETAGELLCIDLCSSWVLRSSRATIC